MNLQESASQTVPSPEVFRMLGKQKCKILKEIRQRIADENEIPYVTRECRYQGECSGTCPRCESELRYLEQQLALRASLGKRVAVTALCAGMALSSAGCGSGQRSPEPVVDDLSGAVAYDDPQEPGPENGIEVTTGEVWWPESGPESGQESSLEDVIGSDALPEDLTAMAGTDALPPEIPEQVPEEFELMGDVPYDWSDSGSTAGG